MTKLIAMLGSGVMGLGLAGMFEPGPPPAGKGDGPEAKKKEGHELRKAYDLIRRLKADADKGGGRDGEKLGDWTRRAADLYRKAVDAARDGQTRKADELALAAHDLARAVDHSRNALRYDRPDPDLPPPPDGDGLFEDREPLRKDLRKAYDRLVDLDEVRALREDTDAQHCLAAARDLYNAARIDARAGRHERAAELARAAEAMSHVPEHLARAEGRDIEIGPGPKEKAKAKEKAKGKEKEKARAKEKEDDDDRPEPKRKRDREDREDDELPPALPR